MVLLLPKLPNTQYLNFLDEMRRTQNPHKQAYDKFYQAYSNGSREAKTYGRVALRFNRERLDEKMDDIVAYTNIISILHHMGKGRIFDAGKNLVQICSEIGSEDGNFLLSSGEFSYHIGDFSNAVGYLDKAKTFFESEKDANYREAHRLLGYSRIDLGRTMIERNNFFLDSLGAGEDEVEDLDDEDLAKRHIRTGIGNLLYYVSSKPEKPVKFSLLKIAQGFSFTGNKFMSVKYLDKASEFEFDTATDYVDIGYEYHNIGEFDKAKKIYETAIVMLEEDIDEFRSQDNLDGDISILTKKWVEYKRLLGMAEKGIKLNEVDEAGDNTRGSYLRGIDGEGRGEKGKYIGRRNLKLV